MNERTLWPGRRGLGASITLAATLACLWLPSSAAAKKEEKQETGRYVVAGSDPAAFVNAAALYASSGQTLLADEAAGRLRAALELALGRGVPWSPALWLKLERLRGVKMSTGQIEALQASARKLTMSAAPPAPDRASTAGRAFAQGNEHFEARGFSEAVEDYRAALVAHPAHWDAWNNLALAELHAGNDLVALFLWSALLKNNPRYVGATINLTVCLERLGQSARAFDLAATLAAGQAQMPMAQYNAAWLENARGNYAGAEARLGKALDLVPTYAPAQWLRAVNMMEAGQSLTADDLAALPEVERQRGLPAITAKTVAEDQTELLSGETVVAQAPKGSRLAISGESGDWSAVYWSMGNVKRRLWLKRWAFTGAVTGAELLGLYAGAASKATACEPEATGTLDLCVRLRAVNGTGVKAVHDWAGNLSKTCVGSIGVRLEGTLEGSRLLMHKPGAPQDDRFDLHVDGSDLVGTYQLREGCDAWPIRLAAQGGAPRPATTAPATAPAPRAPVPASVSVSSAPVSGAVVSSAPAPVTTAPVSPAPASSKRNQASVGAASSSLAPFLGAWTGTWADVTEKEIRVAAVGGAPRVTMHADQASNARLRDGRLSFDVTVSGSGWKLVYTLTAAGDHLDLDVHRLRDDRHFAGKLSRK